MHKVLILLAMWAVAVPSYAEWRRGALFGADVRALVVDHTNPDLLYLGTSGGEVYVSRDGAATWSRTRNGVPFPGYVVDNLVVDKKGRLWAAAWGLWGGGVIAVSEDGGKSWSRRDRGLEDFSVRAIAVDPNDSRFVVVGGLTGVYRSMDGGVTWRRISTQINVESLAIDPRHHDRIYVGTWRQGWRTDDGGATWKHIANGMVLDTDMFSITIDEEQPDNVWVATCGWVYNSKDSGELWTRYRDGFDNRRIHDVKIDPCNREVVYAGSVAGLYRSVDGGKNWDLVSDDRLVVSTVVLHPQRPGRVILGVEGDGVYVSVDNARTFARSSEGLSNLRVATVVPDPRVRDRVFAAVMFGGAASGIYRSDDGGEAWQKVSRTDLPEVLSLTIDPDAPAEATFVAGTEKGFFISADGETWTQAEPAASPIRVSRVVRFNRTRSFAATSEGVFTTRDGGRSWYRLGEAASRTVDIAIAGFDGRRALYALTAAGLEIFDGERWITVQDAPAKGRTIAVRTVGSTERIFVAGIDGVRAGSVANGRWVPAEAPDAQHAAVFSGERAGGRMLFLTARAQHQILVGDAAATNWREMPLPIRNTDVTSIVADPFQRDRYYMATFGEGVFVYQTAASRRLAASVHAVTGAGGGGQ